jgi:carbon starvation protein CstA
LREEIRQQVGHISQERLGKNPKGIFMCECLFLLLLLEAILYGSIQSVQQRKEGMEIEELFGTIFKAILEGFSYYNRVI